MVYKKKIFKVLLYLFLCINYTSTPIVAKPNPGDHELNKFKSILPEDAISQVSSFLANRFLRRLFEDLLYTILCKNWIPPSWPEPTYGDHNLNKIKSAFPEDVSSLSGQMVFDKNI